MSISQILQPNNFDIHAKSFTGQSANIDSLSIDALNLQNVNKEHKFSIQDASGEYLCNADTGTQIFTLKNLKTNILIANNVVYNLPPTDGTSGQLLKTDGSGNLTFGDPNGSSASSTGLIWGGDLTIETPNVSTTFNISRGCGIITNQALETPTFTKFAWEDINNIVPVLIGSAQQTFVSILSDLTIVQSATIPTIVESRDLVYLGVMAHFDGVTIFSALAQPIIVTQPCNTLHDLYTQLGYIKVGGFGMMHTTGYQFSHETGVIGGYGINFSNDSKNPHNFTIPAASPSVFVIVLQTGVPVTGLPISDLDISMYDNAGVYTSVTPTNRWTAMFVYSFPADDGFFAILPGQYLYSTSDDAITGLTNDLFIVPANILSTGLVVGYIIAQASAVDLSGAIFRAAEKFGSVGAGTVGVVNDMQLVYNISSPKLITVSDGNITNRAVVDTDLLLDFQTSSTTPTTSIYGDHMETVDPTGAQHVATKNYVDTRPSFPDHISKVSPSSDSTADGTATKLVGYSTTLLIDHGIAEASNWDLITNYDYTVPAVGIYNVNVVISFDSVTAVQSIDICLNGFCRKVYRDNTGAFASASNKILNGSASFACSVNDVITVQAVSNDASWNILGDNTYVEIMRLTNVTA